MVCCLQSWWNAIILSKKLGNFNKVRILVNHISLVINCNQCCMQMQHSVLGLPEFGGYSTRLYYFENFCLYIKIILNVKNMLKCALQNANINV